MGTTDPQRDPRDIIENALWTAEGEASIEEYEVRTALRWLDERQAEIARLRAALTAIRDWPDTIEGQEHVKKLASRALTPASAPPTP
jgi:hypothetical protein